MKGNNTIPLNKRDILWKGAIDDFCHDVVRMFFINADDLFDLNKAIQLLDKELPQRLSDKKHMQAPKRVDSVLKITSKDTKLQWVLLLIEVQGYNDPGFAKRVHTYFSRLTDKYGDRTTALIIYTGNNKKYQPDSYHYNLYNASIDFKYRTYAIADQDEALLAESNNPFAMIVLTALIVLRYAKKEKYKERFFNAALQLVDLIAEKNISLEKKEKLFSFVKSYIDFADNEMQLKFDNKIISITHKLTNMSIMEAVCIIREHEGFEKGIKQSNEANKTQFVTNLLLDTEVSFSVEKIANLANVPVDFVLKVKESLAA